MKKASSGARRILVVEDEPAICEICLKVLDAEGHRVDIVSNGKLAEDRLKETGYDLLIIDIRTPVMNGRQLYQYIIEDIPRLADKLIFTTGDVMAAGLQDFIKQAGRPFLPKPFTPAELRSIVREALGGKADEQG
jgi:CheY-like chemotaxis protein